MASNKPKGDSKSKNEQKITKQFILDHLDEKEIDLSMCNLTQVPVKELALVPRGNCLDLSRNLFTILPDNIGVLKHLTELDLSSNQLTELPDSISQLVVLQKLDLYNNKLTTLPLTFWELRRLKWLDLRNNNLEPDLAEAAGHCVSDIECKQCASKVLIVIKKKVSEIERQRQMELQQKRDEERTKEKEAKRVKAELKQRKKEEHWRKEQERKRKQEEEEQASFNVTENVVEFVDRLKNVKSRGCSCGTVLLVALVVGIVLLALFLLVPYFYLNEEPEPTWTEQLLSWMGLSSAWTEQLLNWMGLFSAWT